MEAIVNAFVKRGYLEHANIAALILSEIQPGLKIVSFVMVSNGIGAFRIALKGPDNKIYDPAIEIIKQLAPKAALVWKTATCVPITDDAPEEVLSKQAQVDLYMKNPAAFWKTMPKKIRNVHLELLTS